MDYPAWMLMTYQNMVEAEIKKRGCYIYPPALYIMNDNTFEAEENGYFKEDDSFDFKRYKDDPFPGWMNDRYLLQCYFNLEEMYDCGGISEEEWTKIDKFMRSINIFWL